MRSSCEAKAIAGLELMPPKREIVVTRNEQLHIGLFVCETVLEALIRTHPNKSELRRELSDRFAALQTNATLQESLGEQEEAHMKAAMDAFLMQIDGH
jgi:hypothetical protein